MALTVKELDESTWDAFAELVERNNGIFGGCWCTAFHCWPRGTGKVPLQRHGRTVRGPRL